MQIHSCASLGLIVALLGIGSEIRAEFDSPFRVQLQLSPVAHSRMPTLNETTPPSAWDTEGPGSGPLWAVLRVRAERIQEELAAGNLAQARRLTRNTLEEHGDLSVYLFYDARISTLLGEYEQAAESWRRLATMSPNQVQVIIPYTEVLIQLGQLNEARSQAERFLAINPYFTHAVFQLFIVHVLQGRPDQAARLLQGMAAPDLGAMADWLTTGERFDGILEMPQWNQVAALLLSGGEQVDTFAATPLRPEEARQLLTRLARIIARFGEMIQNEEWRGAQALGEHPGIEQMGLTAPAFRSFVAYAAHRQGQDGAVGQIVQLTNEYPESLHAQLRYAYVLLETQEYAAALEHLQKLTKPFPDHLLIRLLSTGALAETGQHEVALQQLETLPAASLPFVKEWFESRTPYQRAIWTHPVYRDWRDIAL